MKADKPADIGSAASSQASLLSSSSWYVVHTKPRQEHVAEEQLRRQDFEVYLPRFRVFQKPRAKPGRKRGLKRLLADAAREQQQWQADAQATDRQEREEAGAIELTTHEPMFPRYLFLRPTRPTQSLAVVRSTLGVTRLVAFGQRPALLADDALQLIRMAEHRRDTADLDDISPYEPGMAVRLLDPALAGVDALVQSVSRDRVTLLLEILGRPQTVQVEFARIAPRRD